MAEASALDIEAAGDCVPRCSCCELNRLRGHLLRFNLLSYSQVDRHLFQARLPDGAVVTIDTRTAGLAHFWIDGRTFDRIQEAGAVTVQDLIDRLDKITGRSGVGPKTQSEARRILSLFQPTQLRLSHVLP